MSTCPSTCTRELKRPSCKCLDTNGQGADFRERRHTGVGCLPQTRRPTCQRSGRWCAIVVREPAGIREVTGVAGAPSQLPTWVSSNADIARLEPAETVPDGAEAGL